MAFLIAGVQIANHGLIDIVPMFILFSCTLVCKVQSISELPRLINLHRHLYLTSVMGKDCFWAVKDKFLTSVL